LSEALSNFQSSDDQVTLEVTVQSLVLRNYVDSYVDFTKIIRTQINLKSTEFDSYIIGEETTITFTLKEFKALLVFAEALNLPLQIHFETTGRPAVFIVHNGSTFEAHFVLATSKADSATQATSTQNTTKTERSKRKDNSIQSSVRKKQHLESDISKCLDEDSHLFNFIDIPEDCPVEKQPTSENCNNNFSGVNNENMNNSNAMDCDNIPASPTSKMMVKSVFKRCFESTFDPRSIRGAVLAENSDSD
jgi:cell cycle checkpoint control protein RAD9A